MAFRTPNRLGTVVQNIPSNLNISFISNQRDVPFDQVLDKLLLVYLVFIVARHLKFKVLMKIFSLIFKLFSFLVRSKIFNPLDHGNKLLGKRNSVCIICSFHLQMVLKSIEVGKV